MSSLKEDVFKLLHSEEASSVVRSHFFEGESLDSSWADEDATELDAKFAELGIILTLEEHHGGEGEGEEYWSVWSFNRGDAKVYVKFDGSYYSYDGSEYDSWFFVEPEEYVAVRYNKI